MRKASIILFVSLLFCFASALAQPLSHQLHMSPKPSPYLADWEKLKETVTSQVTNPGAAVEVKFNAKLTLDGALQAKTKPDKMPTVQIPSGTSFYDAGQIIPFSAVEFFGSGKETALRTGMLKAGSYQLCVELIDPKTGKPLTPPACVYFRLFSFKAPVCLQPTNAAKLKTLPGQIFRWSPVSPIPAEPVHYNISVFEVLKGQTATQAFRSNKPILTEEVIGGTQFIFPPSVIVPDSGQLVWSVQAKDEKENPIGGKDGWAEPQTFVRKNPTIVLDSIPPFKSKYPQSHVPSSCVIKYEWCPGPPIDIKGIDYYYGTDAAKKTMPGDLIGFSVNAEDEDLIFQQCICPAGIDAIHHIPTYDRLNYDWDVQETPVVTEISPRKFVAGSESNSMLYQLPFCYESYPINILITVILRNSNMKANDNERRVDFQISARLDEELGRINDRRYVVFDITKKLYDAEPFDCSFEHIEKKSTCCTIMKPKWEEGKAIDIESWNGNIISQIDPADKFPDNIKWFHAFAHDYDSLVLRCSHDGVIVEMGIGEVYDYCSITWSTKVVGSFPIGDSGPAVIFQHNYGANPGDINCNIDNSKSLQFPDKLTPNIFNKYLTMRQMPRALVAVGDISAWSGLLSKRAHVELLDAAQVVFKKYNAAGYQTLIVTEITTQSLGEYFQDSRYQAITLMGHGSPLGFLTTDGLLDPGSISAATSTKWGCRPVNTCKQPFVRELILLGCLMGVLPWKDNVFNMENYFSFTTTVASSDLCSRVSQYVKNKRTVPVGPRIILP